MKRRKILLMLSLLMPLSLGGLSLADNTQKHVAITAIVEHPALDQARQGIIDELKEAGFEEEKIFDCNFKVLKAIAQRQHKLPKNMPAIVLMSPSVLARRAHKRFSPQREPFP